MKWTLLILLLAAAIAAAVGLFGPVAIAGAFGVAILCVVGGLSHRAWREWPRITPEQQEKLDARREELRRLRAGG